MMILKFCASVQSQIHNLLSDFGFWIFDNLLSTNSRTP